jgi:hypothetical protein
VISEKSRLFGENRLDRNKIYTRSSLHFQMNFRRFPWFSRPSPELEAGSTLVQSQF